MPTSYNYLSQFIYIYLFTHFKFSQSTYIYLSTVCVEVKTKHTDEII